jgi:hypothetical protein
MMLDDMSCSKWDRPARHDGQVDMEEKGLESHMNRTFEGYVIGF